MTEGTQGSPKRRWLLTALFVLVVGGVIAAFIALSQNPAPRPTIPNDADHSGLTLWQDCLRCHDKGQPQALKPSHPLSNQKCLRCHSFAPQSPLKP